MLQPSDVVQIKCWHESCASPHDPLLATISMLVASLLQSKATLGGISLPSGTGMFQMAVISGRCNVPTSH